MRCRKNYIDKSFAGGGIRNQSSGFGNNWGGGFEKSGGFNKPAFPARKEEKAKPFYSVPTRPQTKEHTPSADFIASDTSNLQAGQKVEHQKFGFGEVLKMEGAAAHNPIATVLFELNGEKKIMLNYAKLKIIDTPSAP